MIMFKIDYFDQNLSMYCPIRPIPLSPSGSSRSCWRRSIDEFASATKKGPAAGGAQVRENIPWRKQIPDNLSCGQGPINSSFTLCGRTTLRL